MAGLYTLASRFNSGIGNPNIGVSRGYEGIGRDKALAGRCSRFASCQLSSRFRSASTCYGGGSQKSSSMSIIISCFAITIDTNVLLISILSYLVEMGCTSVDSPNGKSEFAICI